MLDDSSFASLFKEACRNAGVDVDKLIRTTVPPPTQQAEEGPGFAD
jgi:sugar/nucleoside kinase (ribokinase family)